MKTEKKKKKKKKTKNILKIHNFQTPHFLLKNVTENEKFLIFSRNKIDPKKEIYGKTVKQRFYFNQSPNFFYFLHNRLSFSISEEKLLEMQTPKKQLNLRTITFT